MTIPVQNYTWEQGTDLVLKMIFKIGTSAQTAVPVDLTGYSLRMDIRTALNGNRIWTFNSDDITEPGADEPGDADNEVVLGSDGSINITVPRSLTLEGGAIFDAMNTAQNPTSTFVYDVILRDTINRQSKILSGTITVNRSVTLWT